MKYTELAKEADVCFGCGKGSDGTFVLAHRNLNGWGMLFGRSIKSLSMCGAILCSTCHDYGDKDGRRDSKFWEMAVQRTQTWAWENGWLTLGKGGDRDKKLR